MSFGGKNLKLHIGLAILLIHAPILVKRPPKKWPNEASPIKMPAGPIRFPWPFYFTGPQFKSLSAARGSWMPQHMARTCEYVLCTTQQLNSLYAIHNLTCDSVPRFSYYKLSAWQAIAYFEGVAVLMNNASGLDFRQGRTEIGNKDPYSRQGPNSSKTHKDQFKTWLLS